MNIKYILPVNIRPGRIYRGLSAYPPWSGPSCRLCPPCGSRSVLSAPNCCRTPSGVWWTTLCLTYQGISAPIKYMFQVEVKLQKYFRFTLCAIYVISWSYWPCIYWDMFLYSPSSNGKPKQANFSTMDTRSLTIVLLYKYHIFYGVTMYRGDIVHCHPEETLSTEVDNAFRGVTIYFIIPHVNFK